jgi:tetraacyldisaccharide 4'-kinase
MLKLRLLLLPFSWIYGGIVALRNYLYDIHLFHTFTIPKKSICVGNLSTGGTGKTPHVAYIAEFLKEITSVSILSRGYGRKTTGFILADEKSKSEQIGDEPLFYVKRFSPKVQVAVCEKRSNGVQKIQTFFPDNKVIILDDAFQHRAVEAGLNILLTDYYALFSRDFILPAGNLREQRKNSKRADYIIVTKCPKNISEKEKQRIAKELNFNRAKIYFSTIRYGNIESITNHSLEGVENILLVTGIAYPKPLISKLKNDYNVEVMTFSDHHDFTDRDILAIHQKFDTFASNNKAIVTTEKDYMRLVDRIESEELQEYPWFYQSIDIELDKKETFNNLLLQYVNAI